MNVPTAEIRPLAIVAGIACVIAALTILLGPSLFHPAEWTHYHAITVLVVFVTIAFLHLRAEAWRSGHMIAACGFVLLAFVGTSLIVGQSAGRQAEAAGSTMMSVEDTNAKIVEKNADLAKARKRFDEATQYGDDEMKGQKCLKRCNDWRQRAKEVQALISQLEGEIAALGPQKPVNAKAEKIADLFEVFGIPRGKSMALWTLIEPFALTLLFEFGSVISFGYAFGHRPIAAKIPDKIAAASDLAGQSDFPAISASEANVIRGYFGPDNPDQGPDRGPKRPGPKKPDGGLSKSEALDDLMQRLADGRTVDSQDALAADWGRPKQTVSDWMREWRRIGVIPAATPAGRRKATLPA